MAQSTSHTDIWRTIDESEIALRGERQIIPIKYETFRVNANALQTVLAAAPLEANVNVHASNHIISIPMPDGQVAEFRFVESPIMAPELAARYPEIKTYLGQGINDPSASIRFDLTTKGFHGQILSPKGAVYIDPYSTDDQTHYISYYKKNFVAHGKTSFECGTAAKYNKHLDSHMDETLDHDHQRLAPQTGPTFVAQSEAGTELRTYRLALACTGEYATFHGGTVPAVLGAMVTSLNRVNGVYETEVAVRMVLIANNDQLIFLNAGSDPYTNNNGGTMLGQNQSTIDAVIGSANYDIGHVYSTGGGGIASLGSVCSSNRKAQGVTGQGSPVGDPFDIDYVAHEMGHQFDGNHTFNGCGGGSAGTSVAFEPGSATTIMGYAGICGGGTDSENNSDPYFHTGNFEEIMPFITQGGGSNCAVVTATGNNPPGVQAGTGGFFIPISTPFTLIGSGLDPDGDTTLTYSWEQTDLGPGGMPNSPSGNDALFRFFPPFDVPERVFPQISDIVNNTQTLGELLPSYTRSLSFRLTARDNKAGGGGVANSAIAFNVTDEAGPFLVMSPNTAVTWTAGTQETVTWDVANTTASPVNCQTVNILLSTDGGYTYPVTVASGLPNTGSAIVMVPNVDGNMMRIKVEAADNIFFDISNQNFTIELPAVPDFTMASNVQVQAVCSPDDASFTFTIGSLLNFNSPVTLTTAGAPTGANVDFGTNPVVPGNTTTMTVSNTGAAALGNYIITVTGTAASGETHDLAVELQLLAANPGVAVTALPNDGTVNTVINDLELHWNTLPGTNAYDLEVASNPSFGGGTIIETANGVPDTSYTLTVMLDPATVYYWRVRANSQCGTGDYSMPSAFQTLVSGCEALPSADVPVNIPQNGSPTVSSDLPVVDALTITDVNVLGLEGSHSYIEDLTVTLSSPNGTEVVLFDQICGSDNDFDISFDDDAASNNIPCPPTDGNTYQPEEALSAFNGELSQGMWVLTIEDNFPQDGGNLQGWTLQICAAADPADPPSLLQNNVLSVPRGMSGTISNVFLAFSDASSSPDQILYTLVSNTINGEVFKNGVALNPGETFTQQDIDDNLITYTHDNSFTASDGFVFNVTNADGGWFGSPTFSIVITGDVSIEDDLLNEQVSVYPNPATEKLFIELNEGDYTNVNVTLTNIHGQQLWKSELNALGNNRIEMNLQDITTGIYFVTLQTEDAYVSRKLIIQK